MMNEANLNNIKITHLNIGKDLSEYIERFLRNSYQ